jgi:hypothetical protein
LSIFRGILNRGGLLTLFDAAFLQIAQALAPEPRIRSQRAQRDIVRRFAQVDLVNSDRASAVLLQDAARVVLLRD